MHFQDGFCAFMGLVLVGLKRKVKANTPVWCVSFLTSQLSEKSYEESRTNPRPYCVNAIVVLWLR